MKMIKSVVYALIVCMSFVGVAEAKGRAASFKSGFSSQKRAAAKPAQTTYQVPPTASETRNTAFGSFGAATPTASQKIASAPQSQMSNDLTTTGAQNNALRTADARTKADEKMSDATGGSGWFRSGSQNTVSPKPVSAGGTASQSGYYQAAPQYNGGQHTNGFSNGIWAGLMGFMIGHSIAQHTNNVYVPQTGPAINAVENSPYTDDASLQQPQAAPLVETESFFMKLVRVVLWIAVIYSGFWLVKKLLGLRHRNTQRAANYSLRR